MPNLVGLNRTVCEYVKLSLCALICTFFDVPSLSFSLLNICKKKQQKNDKQKTVLNKKHNNYNILQSETELIIYYLLLDIMLTDVSSSNRNSGSVSNLTK